MTNEELLEQLRSLLVELSARLRNYEELGAETAATSDEGLLLAVRTGRLLGDAVNQAWSTKSALELAPAGGDL